MTKIYIQPNPVLTLQTIKRLNNARIQNIEAIKSIRRSKEAEYKLVAIYKSSSETINIPNDGEYVWKPLQSTYARNV